MSRIPHILLIGSVLSVAAAKMSRAFREPPAPACGSCSAGLDSAGFSRFGARALWFLDGVRRRGMVTADEALMLRLLMNPRSDVPILSDPNSRLPGQELVMIRCLAIETAGSLLASGRWADASDLCGVLGACREIAETSGNDSVSACAVRALARVLESDPSRGAEIKGAAEALWSLSHDPRKSISTLSFVFLCGGRSDGVDTR